MTTVLENYQRLTNRLVNRVNETRGLNRSLREAMAPKKLQRAFVDSLNNAAQRQLTVSGLSEASVRLQGDGMLLTVHRSEFGNLTEQALTIQTGGVGNRGGMAQTPAHAAWHQEIYATLTQANAVLLCHPTTAMACASLNLQPEPSYLTEAHSVVGDVVMVENSESVSAEIKPNVSLIIKGIGVLVWGSSIDHAIASADVLNRWCAITLKVKHL